MALVQDYTATYSTFSGADIVASFNGKIIGELQQITYSISREKAPNYTLGSAEPRSFSRGKRGIAGTLIFTVFNRDALLEEFEDKLNAANTGILKFAANDRDWVKGQTGREYLSIDEWDAQMSGLANKTQNNQFTGTTGAKLTDLVKKTVARYADEILPFDITISMANEYGQMASLVIYGVEILNEGSGYSIDSVTTEKAYSFVARRIEPIKKVSSDGYNPEFTTTF